MPLGSGYRRHEREAVIVCHCHVVNDAAVAAAVDAGARTLSEVCRATCAGRDCGACVFSVRRLVCEHVAPVATESAEPCHAAS
jgi:bacterioferritin-associated ferredoxin